VLYTRGVHSIAPKRSHSAYYSAQVSIFLGQDADHILGRLAAAHAHDLELQQRHAWEEEIEILKNVLRELAGTIFLEFEVPRLGSRVDAVLVSGSGIFPIEFKCGERLYQAADINQVWDYALDLKNFHLGSHDAPILPILVATRATFSDEKWQPAHADGVCAPRRCCPAELAGVLSDGLRVVSGPSLDGETWGNAPYHPTPTIVEAARALYSRHTVESITRNDAGAQNLAVTSGAVDEIIDRAQQNREKAIVFVTGVPGAGKTLVGLNLATRRHEFGDARAVFLSGNEPLVAVLQEALTRDELDRLTKHTRQSGAEQGPRGKRVRKSDVRREVKQFIQNVHHFRDEGIRTSTAPFDHVVIFDEAQRAWNTAKTADFMKRRKKLPDFNQSESEVLISYLDRHKDWAVVVCLVGGGQEIHTGEAGIGAWIDAVRESFGHWTVYVSPDLTDSEYGTRDRVEAFAQKGRVASDNRLHLSNSMRAFRSEKVSAFVKALLDRDSDLARDLLQEISPNYPVALTRDLAHAKQWILEHKRGSERYGIVVSSEAQRLKPYAIDVRINVNPVQWFLNDRHDTRSSYYLEDAATEFQIQGLELDWICIAWDADLSFDGQVWRHRSFRGDRWTTIHKEDRKRYLLNAYRVLLTRARQGMVIFVPPGEEADPTRAPALYDETYMYLSGIGIHQV